MTHLRNGNKKSGWTGSPKLLALWWSAVAKKLYILCPACRRRSGLQQRHIDYISVCAFLCIAFRGVALLADEAVVGVAQADWKYCTMSVVGLSADVGPRTRTKEGANFSL